MVKILIVEDDEAVRLATKFVLEGAGHQVVEARNGLRIEATIDEHKPDLVLTDMLMPDRDGVETVLALRRHYPKLPIIAMSGGGKRGMLDLDMVKRLGAWATLDKPFDAEKLKGVIEDVLSRSSPK
jgi:DNA-binding NtrC family response regulator